MQEEKKCLQLTKLSFCCYCYSTVVSNSNISITLVWGRLTKRRLDKESAWGGGGRGCVGLLQGTCFLWVRQDYCKTHPWVEERERRGWGAIMVFLKLWFLCIIDKITKFPEAQLYIVQLCYRYLLYITVNIGKQRIYATRKFRIRVSLSMRTTQFISQICRSLGS